MKKWPVIAIVAVAAIAIAITMLTRSEPGKPIHPTAVSTTLFSQEGAQIKMGINDATADENELNLSLTLSGLDLASHPEYVDSLVCIPYVVTKQNVGTVFKSLTVSPGDPNVIHYTYALTGNAYAKLDINMDWTVGPCSVSMNESNVTPVPESLLVNSHFEFSVPVE